MIGASSWHIESPEVCAAKRGWFLPQVFAWKSHVTVFDGETLKTIQGAEGRDHMHAHH